MTRIAVVCVFVLAVACGSGQSISSAQQSAAEAQLSAQLAQAGVQCAPHTPPEVVQACSGKSAGDQCTVTHENERFTGVCRTTADGMVACAPPAAPPPIEAAIAACTSKSSGDSCQFSHDDVSITGTCRQFGSGVVACTPTPLIPPTQRPPPSTPPIVACNNLHPGDSCSFTVGSMTVNGMCRQFGDGDGDSDDFVACLPVLSTLPPVASCANLSAGAACTITAGGKTLNGFCHQLPNGGPLVCLPPPPSPPQETIDACSGHSAGDACSVTFNGHTITGACQTRADGTTLACAPVCRRG
jgi:hypothetical protein